MAKITVQNTEITVLSHDDKDYISLTDMANGKQSESRAADVIKKLDTHQIHDRVSWNLGDDSQSKFQSSRI